MKANHISCYALYWTHTNNFVIIVIVVCDDRDDDDGDDDDDDNNNNNNVANFNLIYTMHGFPFEISSESQFNRTRNRWYFIASLY